MGSQGGTIEEPKSRTLARQGSLYSLSLDEVQSQLGDLGKPLGSMNLDELLKYLWTAEANQAVDNATNAIQQQRQPDGVVSLQRHSSVTLSRDLSKKTVEEVWKDILQKKNVNQDKNAQDRQPTLGEMTLEDFLLKAGVAAESSVLGQTNVDLVSGVNTVQTSEQIVPAHSQWIQFQPPSVQHQHQHQPAMMPVFMPDHQPLPISTHQMVDVIGPETQMNIQTSSLMDESDAQRNGRKRVAPGAVAEKSVERRQKRMIKNRESAARSRARRQAYTHELEIKVSRLEEENERLRKEMEKDKMVSSLVPTEPKKHQLRRTSSSLF